MSLPQLPFVATYSPLAVTAVPEIAFALQLAGLGGAVGSAMALRAQRRWSDVNTWRITTAWASLGLVLGVLVIVGDALL